MLVWNIQINNQLNFTFITFIAIREASKILLF
jgi:hypothetical protein